MRKILILPALLVFLSTACSDDDSRATAPIVGTWVRYALANRQGGYERQYIYSSDGTFSTKSYTGTSFEYVEDESFRGQWGLLPDGRFFSVEDKAFSSGEPAWSSITMPVSNITPVWSDGERIVFNAYMKTDMTPGLEGTWIHHREWYTLPSVTPEVLYIDTLIITGTNACWSNHIWETSMGTISWTNSGWILPESGRYYKLYQVDEYGTNTLDMIWEGTNILAVDVNNVDVLWK